MTTTFNPPGISVVERSEVPPGYSTWPRALRNYVMVNEGISMETPTYYCGFLEISRTRPYSSRIKNRAWGRGYGSMASSSRPLTRLVGKFKPKGKTKQNKTKNTQPGVRQVHSALLACVVCLEYVKCTLHSWHV